jgi:hypothetical protein
VLYHHKLSHHKLLPLCVEQVRQDGGIAPLVRLLNSWDLKVQRAGAGALRTLAFKNDDNKRQIVDCGALPLLIQVCVVCCCYLQL